MKKIVLILLLIVTEAQLLINLLFIKFYVKRFCTCAREEKQWFANYFLEMVDQEQQRKALLKSKKERYLSKWNSYRFF